MARVFITGSSDGLGLMAAKLLIEQGHEVVAHGQNDARRVDALRGGVKGQGRRFRRALDHRRGGERRRTDEQARHAAKA